MPPEWPKKENDSDLVPLDDKHLQGTQARVTYWDRVVTVKVEEVKSPFLTGLVVDDFQVRPGPTWIGQGGTFDLRNAKKVEALVRDKAGTALAIIIPTVIGLAALVGVNYYLIANTHWNLGGY